MQHTAKIGETVRERHLKWQAFTAGLQSDVNAFILREASQAAAVDGIKYSINTGNTNQGAHRNLLLFSGIKKKVKSWKILNI